MHFLGLGLGLSGSSEEDKLHVIESPIKEKQDAIKNNPWGEMFDSSFIQTVTMIQKGLQVAHDIQSSVASFKEKSVIFTYNGNTVRVNIGHVFFGGT